MIGRVLGNRYRVDDLIGRGGMAIVYRAYDKRTRKTVAIKVLREEYMENEEFLKRFDREAMVCAKTSHTNIVNLLDLGEEEGARYLVMEFVNGRTLKDIIAQEGHIAPERAVSFTIQMLQALSHAHARNIIHRDIKPQNMLVNAQDHLKVADFGIARMTDAQTMTSADGNVMGSVHYFSPEQAKGEQVLETSDLYSVGITLYEMLCGHVPFEGDTAVSVAMKHVTELPKPLINQIEVSPALDQIVQKALCKQLNQRYQSADDMIRDLKRSLHHPEGGFVNMRPVEESDSRRRGYRNSINRMEDQARHTFSGSRKVVSITASVIISLMVIGLLVFACVRVYHMTVVNVTMPDIVGLDEEGAQKMIENKGLLPVVSRRSDQSVKGVVIDQSPVSGKRIRRGDAAYVVVSNGPDTIMVPNTLGMNSVDAANAIVSAGLKLGEEIYEMSESIVGTVIIQYPSSGMIVESGATVDIYISRGLVIMSELTGKTLEEAKLEVSDLGLTVGEVQSVQVDNIRQDGVVIAQDPQAFAHTYPEREVDITVGYYDKRKYSAQVTIGVDLPQEGANVRIALVESTGKESDQFNWTYKEGGKVEINVTLRSETSGKMAYRLYIDNAFISETPITLQASGDIQEGT